MVSQEEGKGQATLIPPGTDESPARSSGPLMSCLASTSFDLVRRLHELVREHPDFEVLLEPTKYHYCFRYVPNALSERQDEDAIQRQLDDLNREIVAAVQHSCALVMTTSIRGRLAIRISIRSIEITEVDVDAAFESIAQWGRLLFRNHNYQSAEVEKIKCSNEFCSSPTEA